VFARHLKLETGKMLVKQAPVQQVPKKPLTASIACNILEVREAQRLR
jgi:hypothetical protein